MLRTLTHTSRLPAECRRKYMMDTTNQLDIGHDPQSGEVVYDTKFYRGIAVHGKYFSHSLT